MPPRVVLFLLVCLFGAATVETRDPYIGAALVALALGHAAAEVVASSRGDRSPFADAAAEVVASSRGDRSPFADGDARSPRA